MQPFEMRLLRLTA
uniref:Uncharacterized protein n=1 Tax=Anguilla anguilla TaxID=7936 RepID=A0A0E9V487_ANGAN